MSALGPRTILLVSPEGTRTCALPEDEVLLVGRDAHCELRLEDPRVSREHARLCMGPPIEVEDLGSANGTRVGGAKLEPGERRALLDGQVLEVGDSMLLLQRTPSRTPRRLMTHAHFEAHLEEACAASDIQRVFCVLRVRVQSPAESELVCTAITQPLGAGDLVASYAKGEYELLLQDATRSRGEAIAEQIIAALGEGDALAQVGIAAHPKDATNAERLLSCASEALGVPAGRDAVVIESPAMRDLYRVLERVAQGQISVLLTGETGVGKEVVAEAVHRHSPRANAPFVRLNCAALSQTLVESELFGHERGAFTGATSAKEGLLEVASGGTVFLDELGELPPETQAKLLRVLEQREVMRVGGLKPRPINVRFVAATNRDLEQQIQRGRFREDLYYRLNGVTLHIPPLRERLQEVAPIARAFLARFAGALGQSPPKLTNRALALLEGYAWPGNIRELRNIIERAVLIAAGDEIDVEHLPIEKLSAAWSGGARGARPADDPEKARILDALQACGGNQTRAAERLGVSRRTLTKWLNRYKDIPRPKKGGS